VGLRWGRRGCSEDVPPPANAYGGWQPDRAGADQRYLLGLVSPRHGGPARQRGPGPRRCWHAPGPCARHRFATDATTSAPDHPVPGLLPNPRQPAAAVAWGHSKATRAGTSLWGTNRFTRCITSTWRHLPLVRGGLGAARPAPICKARPEWAERLLPNASASLMPATTAARTP